MSGLFQGLSIAANALEAQRRGLELAGHNIANAGTAGYTRRVLDLAERTAPGLDGAGFGVEVSQVRAVRDLFIEARIRQEQGGLARSAAAAEALSVVEIEFGAPGEGIDADLSRLFTSFSSLAANASSGVHRDEVLRAGERLAASFRTVSSRLVDARMTADVQVRTFGAEVNALSAEVARLSVAIGDNPGSSDALYDQRQVALRRLADIAGASVIDSAGVLTVSLPSGFALVSGITSRALEVQSDAGTGLARLHAAGEDVTSTLTQGRLGGILAVRDEHLPDYQSRLDELAWIMATEINSVHAAGTDQNGDPGGPFFDVPVTAAGAASLLHVNALLASDSRLIAAGVGGPTDNRNAQALAGLRDRLVADGGTVTLVDGWGKLLYHVGSDLSTHREAQRGRQQVVDQIQRIRESVSGVSIDEEAASLMRFQRAYEANARYFQSVVDTIDILMRMVR